MNKTNSKDFTTAQLEPDFIVMDQLISDVRKRKDLLENVIAKKKRSLSQVPDGYLKTKKKGEHYEYYHFTEGCNPAGKYLKKAQMDVAQKLAQKSYDQRVLMAADMENKALELFLDQQPNIRFENVYEELSEARKELVFPAQITDQQLIKLWLDTPYNHKGFPQDFPEFYSDNNERVRSKSEVLIANLLKKLGIPYKYECPLILKNGAVLHPDFTLLDVQRRKQIYMEHLGMMDEADYSNAAIERILLLEDNDILPGINLIISYETKKHPLNIKALERKILCYF